MYVVTFGSITSATPMIPELQVILERDYSDSASNMPKAALYILYAFTLDVVASTSQQGLPRTSKRKHNANEVGRSDLES